MIDTFIIPLLNSVEQQLSFIQMESDNIIQQTDTAIEIATIALQKLLDYLKKHKIKTPQQEIYIFKQVKPQILSHIIYYTDIKSIQLYMPIGGTTKHKKYLNNELQKLKTFYKHNRDIIAYYRSGDTIHDSQYFTRYKQNRSSHSNPLYYQMDHKTSILHDYTIAQIIAYDRLQHYLQQQINKIQNISTPTPPSISESNQNAEIIWTASKVDLVELSTALHEAKVFNHGNVKFCTVLDFMQKTFNVQLSQPSRIITEINKRKIEPTKFLNTLTKAANDRINKIVETKRSSKPLKTRQTQKYFSEL